MLHNLPASACLRAAEVIAREVSTRLAADGDAAVAIAHLNAEIIAFQRAGADLPANLIRLSQQIVSDRTSCADAGKRLWS